MIVYTSICMNYLPKALCLGESLKKTNPNVKFYVILLEREIPDEWPEIANKLIDEVILAKDLGWEDFDKYIFKHSIVEASTSVKGQALVYLLKNVSDKVLYIDPDIYVYKELNELDKLLDKNDVILTPHLTIPESNKTDIDNNELCALQHGVYNLGFVGVKNSNEGLKFANWWNDRLQLYCYDDIPKGIFTDQRWIDLAPAYFNVYILKHPGYNMAPWNLSTRKLSIKDDKILVNDEYELFFFHYSGFDSGANENVFNYYVKDKKNVIYKLRNEYVDKMNLFGQDTLGKYKWTYSRYNDSRVIDRETRIIYRDAGFDKIIRVNPFSLSDKHIKEMISPTKFEDQKSDSFLREIMRLIIPFKLRKFIKDHFF